MVIVNGYLQGIELSGGGFDDLGQPIAEHALAGKLIPCNISSQSHNKQGQNTDSMYEPFSAVIVVELQEFHADRVNLFDKCGRQLCKDKLVQDVQVLEFVNALQITI